MQTIYDAKILLVDDTPELLELLQQHLHAAGYQNLTAAGNCAAARAAFAASRPDLMVLDINLPDGDGFALFRQLRAQADIPALFLSARDADSDRLFGLGLGADDYLTKPFLMQELLLRIQNLLQRAYRASLQRSAPVLQLGPRTVELEDALVRLPGGDTLPLTATERTLLWGQDYYGYENSLNVHIRHLREKIEENASKPRWLLTVRGIGYKLAGEGTR